jgi:two-component system, cell cycle sensor histidine kinase and response regulator CckA
MIRDADFRACGAQPAKPVRLFKIEHLLIAATFALIIATLLMIANAGMDVLTSMRAYVGGEGLWSKAQKDAVHYLLRYATTRSSADYELYLRSIAVPLADHVAREELQKPRFDRNIVSKALVRGRNNAEDAGGMITLFRRYHFEPHIAHAIEVWTEADMQLQILARLGSDIHAEIASPSPDGVRLDALLKEVNTLNENFPRLEDEFSRSLGDAARYARSVVFDALVAGAVLALFLGLFVSYRLLLRAHDADERYRHLFSSASDAIVIADQQTQTILDANSKLTELTGIPIARLLGTKQSELFGREIPSVAGSSSLDQGDLVIRHTGGKSIPVDLRSNIARFGGRTVEYSIVRDIRERRQLEAQLQEAARMEAVGRLAGGISHDFNNLLTVIFGHAQALHRMTTGDARDKMESILHATHRAAILVRQILAFSRKQPLQPQTLDLSGVVRHMTDLIRGVLNEQIELKFDLAPDLQNVEADPHQMEQIILNLCSNARDSMPAGGAVVIKTWNAHGGFVGLQISDTGTGMDETTLGRIFEPFFTTKPQGKGTGLGLAMVHGTVKQSGGSISVQSELGAGTTVSIFLPRSAKPLATGIGERAFESSRGSETVLLIEDDDAVREVLGCGLEQEGYQVHMASNGKDGMERFHRHRAEISVVITDLVMPEMGGLALADELCKARSSTPIIYVTGYHRDLEKLSAHELPLCGALLLKPFTPQKLAQTVRTVLEGRATNGRALYEVLSHENTAGF